MIKVLIIDDSALVRQVLTSILSPEEGFEVAVAMNAEIGEKKMNAIKPDVLILDIELPGKDGITYLKEIMAEKPLPVIICSGVTEKRSDIGIEALQLGAVEIIKKPELGTRRFFEESKTLIIDIVKGCAKVHVKQHVAPLATKIQTTTARTKSKPAPRLQVQPKLTADAILSLPKNGQDRGGFEKVIVVGASTGGTEALRVFLESIPPNLPPMLIVQHMPEHFTKAFADRLNTICPAHISEATNNELLTPGKVLIAPGSHHMLLRRRGNKYFAEVRDGALVSRHRPSVDVLFRSAARYAGKNAIGVIFTGMGDDGSTGMMEMKQNGATNIAQNEATCIVYGMPKEAVKKGGVDFILPLQDIAQKVIELSSK